MRRRSGVLAVVLSLLVAGLFAPLAHADVNDFVIDEFAGDYTLSQDDPQGALAIKEQMVITFTDNNHGIFRALLKKYNGAPLHLKIQSVTRDGVKEDYETSTSNGNLVLKIGDANKTITGQHQYEIAYTVRNVMRFTNSGAELDWNVNGTGWQQPFSRVIARVHVPLSLEDKRSNERCFTGTDGSTASDCTVKTSEGVTTHTTTRALTAGETLTFNESVPAGYFTKPGLADKWADYGRQIITVVAIPLIALIVALRGWYRSGRDAKGRGTIVPEYAAPEGLKPAEIDVLRNNKLGKHAVSATIIDLAIRKYLRIQEGETKGILGLGKHKTYSFLRLPPPTTDTLSAFEATIMNGLFTGGDVIELASLKNKFYKTLQAVQKSIPKSLHERGFFATNPATVGNLWLGVAIALGFGAFFLLSISVAAMIGTLIAAVIILIFALLMPSRTLKGAAAKDAAEGLKLYLNTAEKDRIAMLQGPDAPYAVQSPEPKKTVELFEKLLPYAMVLGVEQQWAQQFTDIYKTPPEWYGGNWSTFNAVYLTQSLNDSVSEMNGSFAAPSSSGSGGSAGGGGGGGGGGGW